MPEDTINLSKIKRDKMLETINKVKKIVGNDKEIISGLSTIEYELSRKKYGLLWEDHEELADKKLETQIPIFIEDKTKTIISNTNDKFNFLLEGDNLHSLYLLEKTHKGKIDVIYIDPPYNTGNNDFIYDDDFIDYEDGYRHSKWLSFMGKRLTVAKSLLSDKGVIFISIDDYEQSQLKLLCDDIFGEQNFVSLLSIENNPKGRKNSDFVSTSNEYCLIYAKNKSTSYFVENIPKPASDMVKDESGNFVHSSGKRVLVGENAFNDIVIDFSSEKHYSVYYNKSNKDLILKSEKALDEVDASLIDKGYIRYYSYYGNEFVLNTYTKSKFKEMFENGELDIKENKIYGKNFSTKIRIKSLIVNREYKAIIDNKIIDYKIDVKTTSAGTMLKEIFAGTNKSFPNPKNIGLIKLLIMLFEDKNITVLDFFAGSGTTAHAVMDLNKEDGGKRQFILCTNNENDICENVTYERVIRVSRGYSDKSAIPINLKYFKTVYIPRINSEEENLRENLLTNIENLISLENGLNIDNKILRLELSEEDIDKFSDDKNELSICEKLYISSDILLTEKQEKLFKDNNIEVLIIPEYYFAKEILEAT